MHTSMIMSEFMNNIRKVVPYVPGEQPQGDVIKLNTNENPYPPAPEVREIMDTVDVTLFRKYPDPTIGLLTEALAEEYSVKPSQVFVGVGSDDVIGMSFLTCFAGEKPIAFPDITYSFYDVWAELFRIPYKMIPVKDDFTIDINDYDGEWGGIIIANPNAPTSVNLGLDAVEELVKRHPECVVIIDEAYVDFGGTSALPLLSKYPNLLITQTFSKSRSMAGMRIGFALGNEELIKAIQDVKYSYNSYTLNRTAILAGTAAVKNHQYFKETCQKIIRTREAAKQEMRNLGFTVLDSKTNFLFVSHKSVPAALIQKELKKRNIYVRYWNKARIENYLRITIGTDEEMSKLYEALREIFSQCR